MAFTSLIGTMQRGVATSIDSGRARLPDFWVAIVSGDALHASRAAERLRSSE